MQKNNDISKNNANKAFIWIKNFRNILYLLGILCIPGIFVIGGIVTSRGKLNSFEFYLLSVFLVLVSGLLAYFPGQKEHEEQAKRRFKGEAEKALRRIIVISDSAGRIFQNVQEKLDEFTDSSEVKTKKSNELIYEYFYGIGTQMQHLIVNIDASVEDWRDILPEELRMIHERRKKYVEANTRAIQEIKKYREELRKYKKDDSETKEIVGDFKSEFALKIGELQAEIEKIRYQYPSISGYGTTIPLVTGTPMYDWEKIHIDPTKFNWPIIESSEKEVSELQEHGLPLEEKPKKKSGRKSKKKSEE